MAPSYISDLLIEHNVTRSLWSSDQILLFIPKMRRKCRGDQAFATRLWNDLPILIRMASYVAILNLNEKPICSIRFFILVEVLFYPCPMFLLHVMMYYCFIFLLLFLVILL